MASDDMGFNGGLAAALRGDDAFMEAIDAADPNSWGGHCRCGCYFIGKLDAMNPYDAACPKCGSTRFSVESPALESGPAAVRRQSQ